MPETAKKNVKHDHDVISSVAIFVLGKASSVVLVHSSGWGLASRSTTSMGGAILDMMTQKIMLQTTRS